MLQTLPDVVALRVEHVGVQVDRLMWVGIVLGLAFTMTNVQTFAAAGAPRWSLPWWAAWLLDPMVSLVLIAVLRAEQITARYQVPTGVWVRRARWFTLGATYVMNTWASWAAQSPSGIVQHSVPPLVVFVGAEAVTDLRDKLTESVQRAALMASGPVAPGPAPAGTPSADRPAATPGPLAAPPVVGDAGDAVTDDADSGGETAPWALDPPELGPPEADQATEQQHMPGPCRPAPVVPDGADNGSGSGSGCAEETDRAGRGDSTGPDEESTNHPDDAVGEGDLADAVVVDPRVRRIAGWLAEGDELDGAVVADRLGVSPHTQRPVAPRTGRRLLREAHVLLEDDRQPRLHTVTALGRAATTHDVSHDLSRVPLARPMAHFPGQIVSFEPLVDAYEKLLVQCSDDSFWRCKNIALSDGSGSATMNVAANSASSSLMVMASAHNEAAPHATIVGAQEVTLSRLDAVDELRSLPGPMMLKIDVQSHELAVLTARRGSWTTSLSWKWS